MSRWDEKTQEIEISTHLFTVLTTRAIMNPSDKSVIAEDGQSLQQIEHYDNRQKYNKKEVRV